MHIPRPVFLVFCNNMGAWRGSTLVLGQPIVVNTLIITIFAQVSTFSVLVKVLHHLFKVFLAFAQQLVLRFHVQ